MLTSKATSQIAAKVPAAVLQAGLPQSSLPALFAAIQTQRPDALASVPGMTPLIEGALADSMADAYAVAFANVCYAAAAVGATAIIASLVLKDYDQYLTGHIPRQVYKKEDQAKIPDADPVVHLEYGDENKDVARV